jgi:hypothetical protein
MMYKERFIAVIKYNGKVLRERDDVVTLPFGSEYSIIFYYSYKSFFVHHPLSPPLL